MSDKFDPTERFSLHPLEGEEVLAELLGAKEPEEAPGAILEGTGVEEVRPDIISDSGVEGGVDVLNEEPEEPETEA